MGRWKEKAAVCLMAGAFFIMNVKANTGVYNGKIVDTITKDIKKISQEKKFTQYIQVGYSQVENKELAGIKVGKGEKAILINGAHHGRESMTGMLVYEQAKRMIQMYESGATYQGQRVRDLLDRVAIVFVPIVNPDGVTIAMNKDSKWKANGRGVDLNKNYPTAGATQKTVTKPGALNYAGEKPFSEKETQAIRDLCEQYHFETSIAYHSAGEVIYWWYYQTGQLEKRSIDLVNKVAKATQYKKVSPANSTGGLGMTDWFIQKYKKPAMTIEIGKTVNGKTLSIKEWNAIWDKNKDIPLLLCKDIWDQLPQDIHLTVTQSLNIK
ncbi:hypothetical protein CS063_10570 [Sporanaerobium hydrogeniformans]|uniref:Uncharacterized protein n=1 Tax=Sporanaerobium hydrogeniformans TaxID=3072179 RepID=A0AC61DCM1_9FIRM|nr:M14 family zinc carboxypeptidase [Sporanaerobium hydrogeniformans]PHV70327.1 hypothetical protein CS063_10570 [Sporanaerobium hydrogeniformans]